MRFLILCLFLISITGCKNQPFRHFVLPTTRDYNEIIVAIINQDKLILEKEHFLTLKDKLVPIEIRKVPIKKGDPPPIQLNDFHSSLEYFHSLGMFDSNNTELDSLYFEYQNDSVKAIELSLSDRERFVFTSLEPNCVYRTIQFSVPVLNFEQNKAMVRVQIGTELKLTYVLLKIGLGWELANTQVEHIIRCS